MSFENKKVKIISLVLVMLCIVVLLVFNSNITNSIGTRLKEIIGASSIETKIDYEIKELIENKLQIYISIENEKGIEKVTINDEFEIECFSRKKVAIDREQVEGKILNIDVKLVGEEQKENYTLVATTKPKIKVVNGDTLGDGTKKTIYVEYPEGSEKIKNYYSLDNKKTWLEYTEEIELANAQRESFWVKIEYEGRKTINKPVSYLDYVDVIKFSNVTWEDGKASVGITSLNLEYIEYQINSMEETWIKPSLSSNQNIVTVGNLKNEDVVYARINDGTSIIDSASITILDNVPPASFTIDVTDITYDGFKIAGSTQDSESGIASYTYVVAKKGEDTVSVSSVNTKNENMLKVNNLQKEQINNTISNENITQNGTKESINNERGIQTNEQENKNTGERGYNINRVGNYNNSTNNTSRSSNKLSIWTKWISNKSKNCKRRIYHGRSKRKVRTRNFKCTNTSSTRRKEL